jgi:DNA-dependent metalloprotease WSS1
MSGRRRPRRNVRPPTDEHERTYANVKEIDSHFGCYEHLRALPRSADALEKLRRAASLVKPIMRKRGWRIGALAEFLPEDTRLLGTCFCFVCVV